MVWDVCEVVSGAPINWFDYCRPIEFRQEMCHWQDLFRAKGVIMREELLRALPLRSNKYCGEEYFITKVHLPKTVWSWRSRVLLCTGGTGDRQGSPGVEMSEDVSEENKMP